MRSQSTNNESSSGGTTAAATALAPSAAAAVGGAAEQPATGKQEDDYDSLEGLSTLDHMQYKELEKRAEQIVRDTNGELRSELLSPKMTDLLKLLEQMNDIIDHRDQGTSRTTPAVPASHEGVANTAASAVLAFFARGPAAGNAVLDGAMLRLRQGS